MIYCVVPPELKDELLDRLTSYYADNPNVTVIVDRRGRRDRRKGLGLIESDERRIIRDRRRHRAYGTFPKTDVA